MNSPPLSVVNSHPRDGRVRLEKEGHVYFVDDRGGDYASASTLVKSWFPEFDAKAVIEKIKAKNDPSSEYYSMTAEEIAASWERKRDQSAMLGTLLHERIEAYYNGWTWEAEDPSGFDHFRQFHADVVERTGCTPHRTEWVIFDEVHRLAGCVDATFRPSADPADADKLHLYDWKRTGNLRMENRWQTGLGELAHVSDCNFRHYALQLNLYRHILETCYGKTVERMFLVVMHPDASAYRRVEVPRMRHEVDVILGQLVSDGTDAELRAAKRGRGS